MTFVVGAVCIGSVLMLARLRQDELARTFLWLYGAMSVLVLSALLLALAETQTEVAPATIAALDYMEAFVGRYGVMLALPLFAHRAFGVGGRRPHRTDESSPGRVSGRGSSPRAIGAGLDRLQRTM